MKVGKAQFNHRRKMYFLLVNSAVLFLPGFSLHPHICSHLLCAHFLTGKHQTIFIAGTNICSKCLRGNTFLVMLLLYWVSLLYMQVCIHMCPRLRLSKILMQGSHSTEVLNPPNIQLAFNLRIHSTEAGRSAVFVTVLS